MFFQPELWKQNYITNPIFDTENPRNILRFFILFQENDSDDESESEDEDEEDEDGKNEKGRLFFLM